MKNYKDKTIVVVDHGLYFMIAQKLAESFKKVYYYTPWESSFPTSSDTMLGAGFPNVHRTNHLFDLIDEVDLWIFCDIYHSDLQDYLVKIGKRVWGARDGDKMEISRYEFIQHMEKLGMAVPKTELIIGIDNLRRYLKKVEDKYVKTDSMCRGDIETFHHISYEVSQTILDKFAYEVGANQNNIRFIVQDPIPTDAEIGYDGYCIDGQFADECLIGLEVKDKGYIGKVKKYADTGKIKEVNDALSETFKAYGYRGFFSSEIRVGKDGKAYLIDMTCRCPSPPTAVMIELFENLAEIIYEGADGVLIQPIFKAQFGAEVIGISDFAQQGFMQIFYPKSEEQFIKQSNVCMIDGKTFVMPPKYDDFSRVCEVVAIGDTIEKTISDLQDRCGKVQGHKLVLDCSVLNDAIEQLREL